MYYSGAVIEFLAFGNLLPLLQLGIAYLLAFPIAWDREAKARGVGLRTFPLVAIASCAFVLIGQLALQGADAQDKVLAGLMTGIGFIGGGAILREGGNVSGTSTAASIWITAAIGAAVAWQAYTIAIALSVMNLLTLRFLVPVKKVVREVEDSKEHGDDENQ